MKRTIIQGFLLVVFGYVLFVLCHFIYLESVDHPRQREQSGYSYMTAACERAPKMAELNVASIQLQLAPGLAMVDQKFEKLGVLAAKTREFAVDEARVRGLIQENQLLIQEEESSSKEPSRRLFMTLGVPQGSFEKAIAQLRQIGKIEQIEITKTDKTKDFLELNARRMSLTKARDALLGLKERAGRVEEMIRLEQEVLSLEEKIQSLGVQLGKFDKANEFCTVRYSLVEDTAKPHSRSHWDNLIDSLTWAGPVYLVVLCCLLVGLVSVLLIVILAAKVRLLDLQKS